jgi:DEAD/DEAH box helicase domain-containing protein
MVTVCYDRGSFSDELVRYQWQRLWMLVNFIQFLPVAYVWTPQSKNDGSAAGLLWPGEESPAVEDPAIPEWYEELDEELADQLAEMAVEWPEMPLVGDDVLNADGAVIGNAELVFEQSKLAYLLDDQIEVAPALEAAGWTVFSEINALVAAINQLRTGV